MLDVLLESRAARPRRVGGTIASALLHAGLIAGAVALTVPEPVDGKPVVAPPDVRWVDVPAVPASPRASRRPPTEPSAPSVLPTIAAPEIVPATLPPIDVGPAIPPDQVVIGAPGVRTASPLGAPDGSPLGAGAVMDERQVDRAPRLAGRVIVPRYPAGLREAGIEGRVVMRFVVDTLGRAELDELQIVEAPHPQFVESVRAALARYRFTVGEVAGRKVRTRVQMPFEFMLVR
jgi:TonB family protein